MIKRIFEKISGIKPQTAATIFLVLSSLLLISAITLTVLFVIDKSKYESAYGTFLNDKGSSPAIRYVVKGTGYEENIRKIPGNWKNGEYVEIEFIKDNPESVRAIRPASPYVISIIASLAATGFAIYIFRKYSLQKEVKTPDNESTPKEIGGYYS